MTGVLCDQKDFKETKATHLYGNETGLLTEHLANRTSTCEMWMVRYYLQINLEEHRGTEDIRKEANVLPVKDLMRSKRLGGFVICADESRRRTSEKVYEMKVKGMVKRDQASMKTHKTVPDGST